VRDGLTQRDQDVEAATDGATAAALTKVGSGGLCVIIDTAFPLDEAAKAHELGLAGHGPANSCSSPDLHVGGWQLQADENLRRGITCSRFVADRALSSMAGLSDSARTSGPKSPSAHTAVEPDASVT
jgi:hypothetical protein